MTKLNLANGQLSYTKYGKGNKPLLTFHGFGQKKEQFEDWAALLNEYTIYSFDLFYHGASTRSGGKLLKEEWKIYLEEFIQKEQLDSFDILGYSLGGRFAISTAIQFSERTNELILIAPDGIFLSIWFKLATTPVIKWLFKYLVSNPEKLENFISFNQNTRIINRYVADFVRKEMSNVENQSRVYVSWNHFKSLGYSKKELKNYLGKSDFKKRIVLGERDHIIKPNQIIPILDKIGGFEIDILPLKHHQLVRNEVVELLADKL